MPARSPTTLQSDPSTVSRQVATLVKDGLLERRADPARRPGQPAGADPQADAVLADHDRIRLEYFAKMLEGWTDSELSDFAEMLARFTAAYEAADNDWMQRAGRAARRSTNGSTA